MRTRNRFVLAQSVVLLPLPPRAFPPSFVPSTILEETLDQIRDARQKAPPPPK